MRHRAPRADRHVGVAHRVVVINIWHAVGRILKYAHADLINPVLQKLRQRSRRDRLLGLANVPRNPVTVFIQACFQLDDRNRAVTAVLHIFFARPLQSNRRARHSHSNNDGLLGVFLSDAAAPESAARMHFMHDDFFQWNARRFRRGSDSRFAVLRADPDFETVGVQQRRRRLRFHRCVIHERCVILCFDHFRGGLNRLGIVTIFARNRHIVRIQAGSNELHDRFARHFTVVADIPLDRHGLQRLVRAPPVVRNYCDPIVSGDNFFNTAHSFNLGFVKAFYLASKHRHLRNRCVKHAGQTHVGGKHRLANGLVGDIETRRRGADEFPVFRILEFGLFRHVELRCSRRHFAECCGAITRLVSNDTVGNRQFRGGYAPLLGCSRDQHFARRSAGFAQKFL